MVEEWMGFWGRRRGWGYGCLHQKKGGLHH